MAAVYPPQLVRRWRTLAGAAAARFGPPELHQLHLVEVALRLEAPEIGGQAMQARCMFSASVHHPIIWWSTTPEYTPPPCPPLHTSPAGLDIPAESQSFFDSLYQAGRLRAFAGRAWARHQEAAPRSVSDFQLQASCM